MQDCSMYILGLSFGYHDSSATLLKNGQIVSSAHEERFNRSKNFSGFPIQAINYCLQELEITIMDIKYITYYEKPFLKFHRYLITQLIAWPFNFKSFLKNMPQWLSNRLSVGLMIKEKLGFEGDIYYCFEICSFDTSFIKNTFDPRSLSCSLQASEAR